MKKNVASQVTGAQMITAADGSVFTGSVTVSVTGDGGTQATGSVGAGACTHEGNGYHTYAPAQAETNYDLVAFTYTGTGAIATTIQIYTTFPQTGDSFARLGAPAGASVSADVAAVKVDTAAVLNSLTLKAGTIGATGNTTTTLHLTGLTFGDDELNNQLIAVYDNSASEWHSRWITDWVLSTALATLHEALPFTPENSVDTYRVLHVRGDSPSSLGLQTIVDAILNEATSGHTTAGTVGKAIIDILADSNELQVDWVNGGRLDLLVDAILADTGELQTDWVNGGRLDLLIDTLTSLATAIKAKTDSLTFTVAGQADANVQYINDRELTGDGSATPFNVV